MTKWVLVMGNVPVDDRGGGRDNWMVKVLRPEQINFNPMAFLMCVLVSTLLLSGIKESKIVTNHLTAFKMTIIAMTIGTGLGLMEVQNLTPFLPSIPN